MTDQTPQMTTREAELLGEIAALTKALTGLTCGGSEFFTRKGERYVADIEACVAWVRRCKEDAHKRTVDAILARKAAEQKLADTTPQPLAVGLNREVRERLEQLIDDLTLAATPTKPDVVTLCGWSAAQARDDLRSLLARAAPAEGYVLVEAARDAAIALEAILEAPEDASRRPHARHYLDRLKGALPVRETHDFSKDPAVTGKFFKHWACEGDEYASSGPAAPTGETGA